MARMNPTMPLSPFVDELMTLFASTYNRLSATNKSKWANYFYHGATIANFDSNGYPRPNKKFDGVEVI